MSAAVLRNSVANMGAALLPAATTLLTLPLIVQQLGIENYGILTMVVAITGYFYVFDVNLSTASTKYVAEYHARHDMASVYQVISFGALFYFVLGIVGAAVIVFSAPELVGWLFQLSAAQSDLAIDALRLAGAGFLLGQVQLYFNSIPQALQRYDLTAIAEATFGTLVPVGSAALLWLGYGLLEIILLRVAASAMHTAVLVGIIFHLLPGLTFCRIRRETAARLWSFSGYAFLNRMAAVTYAQADKLIIGGVLGMSALAYYTVAAEICGRITSLTYRMASVLLPAASAMEARGEMISLKKTYFMATRYIAYLNGALLLLVCLFGGEVLHYWMGPDFARVGYSVLLFIAIALFFDSLTNVPSLINDALGRPRNTGLFAIVRAVLGALLVWLFTRSGDIGSAAMGHAIAAILLVIGFLVFIHVRSLHWSLGEVFVTAYLRPIIAFAGISAAVITYRHEILLPLAEAVFAGVVTLFAMFAVGVLFIAEPHHRRLALRRLAFHRPAPSTHK